MTDETDIDRDDIDRDDLGELGELDELAEQDGKPAFILTEGGVADGLLCVFPELLKPREPGPPADVD